MGLTKTDTTQFTARIRNDYMRVINRVMKQKGGSKNDALNYLLMLGIIRFAEMKKAGVKPTGPASTTNKGHQNAT